MTETPEPLRQNFTDAPGPLERPPTPIVHSRPPLGAAPPPDEPAPPVKTPTRSSKVWVAVTAVAVIIAAAAVITVLLVKHDRPAPSSAPATSVTAHSSATTPSASAPSTSFTHSPTVAPPPMAGVNVPGLAPFAREWVGMRESVTIEVTGHGRFHYMDIGGCASCSMSEMPYKTMDFMLTSVSNGTASGSVTVSSDPRFPVGEPVVVTLGPRDTIQWTAGGKNEGLFCGSDPAWCGY